MIEIDSNLDGPPWNIKKDPGPAQLMMILVEEFQCSLYAAERITKNSSPIIISGCFLTHAERLSFDWHS
jgi:hypothetical protein